MSAVDDLLENIVIPKVTRLKQKFEKDGFDDVVPVLQKRIRDAGALDKIGHGQRIAITAGSRGISNMPVVLRTLVTELKGAGADPFLIPAMGSHGGATADGQLHMLNGMGISEDSVGAPILSSMEVVEIGSIDSGLPVCIDKLAFEADGIILVNRIKAHVAFRGKYESGLMKMIAIGLGKQKGADSCHRQGFGMMAENIESIARVTLSKANILFGIGLIENQLHQTARIEVLSREDIPEKEPELQKLAKKLAPSLPFDKLDVLILDEIGKNISGTGFDTNVVGRYHTPYASGGPAITRIAALDITEESHGNANGLGILDFTTRRAFDKLEFDQTYPNSLTSTIPTSVKIPMVLGSDRQAIQAAVKTCHVLDVKDLRLVRIKNTQEIGELEVTAPLLEEAGGNALLESLGDFYELPFDESGNLIPAT